MRHLALCALILAGCSAPAVRAALRLPRDDRSALVQRLERAEWVALVRVEEARAVGFARARAEVALEKALKGPPLPPRFSIVHRQAAGAAAEPGASYVVFLRDPSSQPLGGDAAPEEGAFRAVGGDLGPRLRGSTLETGETLVRVEEQIAEEAGRAERYTSQVRDIVDGRRDIGPLRLRIRAPDREGGHTVVLVTGTGDVDAEAFDARNVPHRIATVQLAPERVYEAVRAGAETFWSFRPLTTAEPGNDWFDVELDPGSGPARRKALPPAEAQRLGELWALLQEAGRKAGAPAYGEPWRPGEDRQIR